MESAGLMGQAKPEKGNYSREKEEDTGRYSG
jgi:hypothetical protein